MHVITLFLLNENLFSIINCACYSLTYMGTRPLKQGTTLCTVKLFIQLMYNKNDHLAKWSIFVRYFMSSFAYTTPFPPPPPRPKTPFTYVIYLYSDLLLSKGHLGSRGGGGGESI